MSGPCTQTRREISELNNKIAEIREDMKGATGSVLHALAAELSKAQNQLVSERAQLANCGVVRLHFKVLSEPSRFSRQQMLDAMTDLYAPRNLEVVLGSVETLNLPLLVDLDVGDCSSASLSSEQNQLFANRNNAGANDIVVYFVRSTVPASNGCAAHPPNAPGAVVTSIASLWTLAHEVGHVLGLSHVDDPPPPDPNAPAAQLDRLMTGRGTDNITNPPPDLVTTEVQTMHNSPYSQHLEV